MLLNKRRTYSVLISGFVEMDGALLYMPRNGLKVKEGFKGKKSVRRPPLKLKETIY